MREYTPSERALIDKVELALDWGMFISEEELQKYDELMDKTTIDENTCSQI